MSNTAPRNPADRLKVAAEKAIGPCARQPPNQACPPKSAAQNVARAPKVASPNQASPMKMAVSNRTGPLNTVRSSHTWS